MPGMASSLGVPEPAAPLLMQAAEKPEKGPWRLRPGVGPATVVRRYTTPAPDGIRLMQLGKADKDGLTPVMGSVNAFLQVVRRLHESKSMYSWAIVGDLPAGPRHLAAGFSPYASLYVVVVEPTSQSVLAGRRCARFAREHMGVPAFYVANQVRDEEARRRLVRMVGEEPFTWIPLDADVADAERKGLSPIDAAPGSAAIAAIEVLATSLHEGRLG
jgi:CO dehydrogenase maturation factor